MNDRPIHIEGMGVVGSVLAWELATRGVAFTWNDAELAICAWPACTGSVVPSGFLSDQVGYRFWEHWAAYPPLETKTPIVEPADYWFSAQRAPSGAPSKPDRDIGALRRYPQPSYHVNAAELVWHTRRAFAAGRLAIAPAGATVVVAHGYSERLDRLVWGWSCLVDLGISSKLPMSARRPCLYVQRNRFQVAYAYPCPGTPYWYAGSGHVIQHPKNARGINMTGKYAAWWGLLSERSGGMVVSARQVTQMVQGWRPAGRDTDVALVRRSGSRLLTRPCGSSGVRWAPAVAQAVCNTLGIASREETAHALGD